MDSQSVAVDDVLHVVEQQFDVISLPVCIQCFSWILLGIGVQDPVAALPVDERLDLFILEKHLPSPFRGLLHLEVPVVVRLVVLDGLLQFKLNHALLQLSHETGDVPLLSRCIEVYVGPHPSLFGLPDGLQAIDDGILVIGRDEGARPLDRMAVLLDEFPCPCDV